jgi:hypothetical protein
MQQLGAMTIGEKTEVANTLKTGGQDMQQKTTEELIRLESHGETGSHGHSLANER